MKKFTALHQKGVSLIETMVGLVLGILVTLVITQVWGLFENQKQRSISGSSAQNSGSLALTLLEQDIRSAGAGLNNSVAFDCVNTFSYYESGGTVVSPIPSFAGSQSLVPVRITDGGSGINNSDTLTVKRGSDFLGSIAATITTTMPQSSAVLNVSSTAGFFSDDVILVVDKISGVCTVMKLTQVQAQSSNMQHNPGGSQTNNPPVSYQNSNAWPAYPSGSQLFKIGTLLSRVYSVNSNKELSLVDNTDALLVTTAQLAPDIVSLKAQYGVANTGSENVSAWVKADAASGWNVLNADKVKRIKAIRLTLVSRSTKKEATNVSFPCTNSAGTVINSNGPCAWSDSEPLINLSADSSWQKYRYRIYQTIIPLRNIIWAS
jgi:type IV pilus assembly protein PilW